MPMDDASLAPDSAEIPEGPNMMGDMSNEMPMNNNEIGEDETMEIINQLSPKDKEAVKSYAESLISKDESNDGTEEMNDAPVQDGLNMEQPMNETFIFNKKQLNKLMESFGPIETELEKEKKTNLVKKHKKINKTPFNAPDFE